MPGSPTSRNRRPRAGAASSSPAISSASSGLRPTNVAVVGSRRLRLAGRAPDPARGSLVELAEPLPRLDPELLHERPPGVLIGLERVGLAPAAIQGEHQLLAQPLPDGCSATSVSSSPTSSACRPRASSRSARSSRQREAQLLEPRDLGLREAVGREVRERRPAPERQRLVAAGRPRRAAAKRERRAPPGRRAARSRAPSSRLARVRAACAARPRSPAAPCGALVGGRVVPQRVDQPIARDDPVGVEQQHREQGALLAPAEVDRDAPRRAPRAGQGCGTPSLPRPTLTARRTR